MFKLFRKLPVQFFGIIDPSLKCSLYKPKYCDNEGSLTGGTLHFLAFMEEVFPVVLDENDFEYRE